MTTVTDQGHELFRAATNLSNPVSVSAMFIIFSKIVWWSKETSLHHRIQCTSSWAQLALEEESRCPRCLKCQFRTSTKNSWDWYVYHVYQVMPGEEVHAHDQNDELESLKSSGWDENETGARFAKPKVVPCAICKKWLRTKQKTTFASDQQTVAYFMAYTTGLWAC